MKRTGNPGQRIPKEISERISPSNVMGLLESIFTEDEIAILTSLALSYIEDVRIEDTDVKHAGLRNKYQISTESGVAQRVIYEKDGVLERLSKIGLVEKVEPKVRPGGQKHLYRLYESNHIAACLLEHFRGEDIE